MVIVKYSTVVCIWMSLTNLDGQKLGDLKIGICWENQSTFNVDNKQFYNTRLRQILMVKN